MTLKGRLGLETARVPYVDRYGLLWLGRGRLYVEDGVLRFVTAGYDELPSGDYAISFQTLSCIMLGPGSAVTHDALRLLARHGTGLIAVGEEGTRLYASMPFGPNDSEIARRQVQCWTDKENLRLQVVRRMYAHRLGEIIPEKDINVLRGIEGSRVKETYKLLAQQYGINWTGRHYDRNNPNMSDNPNAAINHSATATEAAAMIAVAAIGAIPHLGFIHEDASIAFVLDIADLFREKVTIPVAFAAVRKFEKQSTPPIYPLERIVRQLSARTFKQEKLVPKMIDKIKEVLNVNDSSSNKECRS